MSRTPAVLPADARHSSWNASVKVSGASRRVRNSTLGVDPMYLPKCSATRAVISWIGLSRERRAAINAMLAGADGRSRLDRWDRQCGRAPIQLAGPELAAADRSLAICRD